MTATSFEAIRTECAGLLQAKDWTAAEELCQSMLTSHPDMVELRFVLGLARLRLGRASEALPDLAAALRADPYDELRNRAVGECLLSLPSEREGIAAATGIIGGMPWNLFVLKPLGALLRRGRTRSDGSRRVHAIGDSHVVHLFTCIPDVTIHWMGPMTMHRVGREPIDLGHLAIRRDDHVVFVFGEIDCRCHVARVAKGGAPEPVMRDLVDRYILAIRRCVGWIGGAQVTVCGVMPAVSPKAAVNEAAFQNFPLAGSHTERAAIARRMNRLLRDACEKAGFGFFDPHPAYADAAGFLIREVSDGLVHVRYDQIGPLARGLGLDDAIPHVAGRADSEAIWKRHAMSTFDTAQSLLEAEAWDGLLVEANRLVERDGPTAQALFYRARALGKLGRREEALEAAGAAVAADPAHVASVVQQGNLLYQAGALAEAADCFRSARRLASEDKGVLSWLAIVLFEMAETGEAREVAIASHERIRTPAFRFGQIAQFCETLDPDGSDERISAAGLLIAERAREIGADVLPVRPLEGRKLRIGAHCSYFHIQSGRRFIIPQLAALDPARFELLLIGGEFDKAEVDGFTVVPGTGLGRSRENVVDALRQLDLDILIEFDGPTPMYDVWARRVAPVQLAAYNYPFQTGLPTMDGFITEELIVPSASDRYFTERVLRLSAPAYAFRIPEAWQQPTELPAMRNGWVTFGFFGNPIKLNPQLLSRWAEVMRAVPGSRLLLGHGDYHRGTMPREWRRRLEAAGIPEDRFDLLPGVAADSVNERYALIDIALDPYPYNGGHTTMEALTLGAPTVSLSGNRLISRHGEAFLTHAGHPELIARSPDEYVAKLVALAQDTERLATLRRELPDRIARSPLCDLERVGRAWGAVLETAYAELGSR